jgi:peptidoglycan hydrolase-like protein with peptidoglycan-binding domain
MAMLRRGLVGEPVRILQEKLGVDADGVFGGATDAALREYQGSNGLSVDGIAGPDTFTSMELYELVLLQRGIRGEMVRRVQEALSIGADGVFGQGTETAVKQWQEQNGVDATGVVDPGMLAMLEFPEFTQDKVDASRITEETPIIELDSIAKDDIEPPEQHAGFIAHVVDVVHSAEDKVAAIGKSIWATVKSIF